MEQKKTYEELLKEVEELRKELEWSEKKYSQLDYHFENLYRDKVEHPSLFEIRILGGDEYNEYRCADLTDALETADRIMYDFYSKGREIIGKIVKMTYAQNEQMFSIEERVARIELDYRLIIEDTDEYVYSEYPEK